MSSKQIIGSALIAVAIFMALYEVTFVLDFAVAREVQLPDPAIEIQYSRCYQQSDEDMHEVAFGTIDNPDVQKEFIISNREHIARKCRQQFPEQLIAVREPSRIDLVDIEPRFW